jgi:hypothetical protein
LDAWLKWKSKFMFNAIDKFGQFFILLAATSILCDAGQTFLIDQPAGVGSVSGTILTDGATGTLSTADILDWNLVLNNGSSAFSLLGPLSGNNSESQVFGFDLTETTSALFFNFSAIDDGGVLFQAPSIGSGMEFVCITADINCDLSPVGISLCLTNCLPQPDNNQSTVLSGNQKIATLIPEPSNFGLVALALVILIGVNRLNRRENRASQPMRVHPWKL